MITYHVSLTHPGPPAHEATILSITEGQQTITHHASFTADGPTVSTSDAPPSDVYDTWDHAIGAWIDGHPELRELVDHLPDGISSTVDAMKHDPDQRDPQC